MMRGTGCSPRRPGLLRSKRPERHIDKVEMEDEVDREKPVARLISDVLL